MTKEAINGARALVQSLVAHGVEVCFANPGTSEMHAVAALDRVEGIRPVLGLFEGVVTGAADGYGRMRDKPAVTLLHLGPGLANGIANLHNARRAASPIVVLVGDHANKHLHLDAPLTSDIESLARTFSSFVHKTTDPLFLAFDGARAVQATLQPPGHIATLILPADAAWQPSSGDLPRLAPAIKATVPEERIARVGDSMSKKGNHALLLRGHALREKGGLALANRIAVATGARLLCDTFTPRLQQGAGFPLVERIPYFAEQAVEFLKDIDSLILVGAKPPVAFFAYPEKPGVLTKPTCQHTVLAAPYEDSFKALESLATKLKAPKTTKNIAELQVPDCPSGQLTSEACAQIVARLLPENSIVVDESATSGAGLQKFLPTARPHDHLGLTGGSIGQGLPVATGAAVACPDRKVVCLHGDGGAMYTVQSLWTQARENLDVITVIYANRSYAILNIELARVGAQNPGPKALSMLDISNPTIDWTALARGMGVLASRAETCEQFAAQLQDAMAQSGPRLIEAVL